MSEMVTPTIDQLQELMDFYKKQTPSAPDWFQTIDVVVGVLLQLEINRRKADAALSEVEG